VSHKKQEQLTFYKHLCSSPVFGGIRVAHHLRFWCCATVLLCFSRLLEKWSHHICRIIRRYRFQCEIRNSHGKFWYMCRMFLLSKWIRINLLTCSKKHYLHVLTILNYSHLPETHSQFQLVQIIFMLDFLCDKISL
jgi:hypothetical protein